MFAIYPASAYPHYTPSSYERYQAAVAKAEAARVVYLREFSSFDNESTFHRSHYQPARRCAPRGYAYDSLYLEEQRQQKHQLYLRRLQQEREERRLQEQLESLLTFVAQVTSIYPPNGLRLPLRRQSHVYCHPPSRSELVDLPFMHRRKAPEDAEDWGQLFNALVGAQPHPYAEPVKKVPASDVENCLKHVFAAPQPSVYSSFQPDYYILICPQAQPEATPRASTSTAPEPQSRLPAGCTKQAPSPSAPISGFEGLLNEMFGFYTEQVKSEATSRPSQPSSSKTPAKETLKHVPTSQPSLPATLESRLRTEYEAEVRDTIQAILESLQTHPSPAPAAPVPTNIPGEPSEPLPAEGKGKAKAAPAEEVQVPKEPSSLDVIRAMETVASIKTAFQALTNDFDSKSLSGLVFTAPPAYLRSRGDDSDTSTDSITRLAYKSHNAPVKFYIHSLNGLLAQLDAVESFGNDEVRKARKEAIADVEAALEEVEHEVDIRFLTFESKRKSVDAAQVPIVGTNSEEVPVPVEVSHVAKPMSDEPVPAVVSVAVAVPDAAYIVDSESGAMANAPIATETKWDEPASGVKVPTLEIPATPGSIVEPAQDILEPEQGVPASESATSSLSEPLVPESVRESEQPVAKEHPDCAQVLHPLDIPVESPVPPSSEPEETAANKASGEPSLPLVGSEPSESETSAVPENIPATPLSDNEEAIPSSTDTFALIPDKAEVVPEVTEHTKSEHLSATIRPISEEPEPFLSTAFLDPSVPSEPKPTEKDNAVLVDDETHSDWSEVDA